MNLRGENASVSGGKVDDVVASILLVFELHVWNSDSAELSSSSVAYRLVSRPDLDFLPKELVDGDRALWVFSVDLVAEQGSL